MSKIRVGDLVMMVDCYEAKKYDGRKWTVVSGPWILGSSEVVLLDGFAGGFAVKCLARVCPVCVERPVVDYLGGRVCSLECDETRHSIDYRFKRFHENNPEVYRDLVVMARAAKIRGVDKLGIGMLFEVLRWRRILDTTGEEFKLSNDFRSRYSRIIMQQEPDLAGIFDTRPLDGKNFCPDPVEI